MTSRSTLLQAIVIVTRKMWDAAARLDHEAERTYLSEVTALLGEYKSLYGYGR